MPNLRLDEDVKALAQVVQMRRREAAERVKAGELIHLNFLGPTECFDRAVVNLQQLADKPEGDGMIPLADVVNYGLAVVAKQAVAEEQE